MRVLSAKALRERVFEVMPFEGYWAGLIGQPERNFRLLCYGPQKSGKSTLVLRLADYVAANFGKVFYNSHEEGFSRTLQERIIQNNIEAPRLFFGHKETFDALMDDSFRRRYYRMVVIDSVQYMGLNYLQYKQLISKYKRTAFVFIAGEWARED